ncbi:unnamed protein product [Arabis nemorensis]|uniref:Late embryogenesis abundant protein LEA-2 subgroup domain-containing protein n=1 Tax=Arabis nemorensis TaxID=586526 RepID=A0A565C8Y9_9BRAS|nr:unnamed protein product [Arabis nemorensis]
MSHVLSLPETWFTPEGTLPTQVSPSEIVLDYETPPSHQSLATPPQRVSTRPPTIILSSSGRTKPWVWLVGGFCCIAAILLIIFLMGTLILYLKDKLRVREILNKIYFDSFENIYGDVSLVLNFTNPTWKHPVRLEIILLELRFNQTAIAQQDLLAFSVNKKT